MFCTEEQRKDCRVEKMGCEGCFYNLEGPMEEYLKCYDEIKRNKHIFKTIEPDFFFKFTEYLINKNKQLEFLYNDCCKSLLNTIEKSKVEKVIEKRIEELYEEIEECNMYDDDDNEEKRELTDMIVLLKEISKELLEK